MRDILEDAEGAAARGDVGPGKANREKDKQSFPKRFYKSVTVEAVEDGYEIRLDDKPIKTPGRIAVTVPTQKAADLICAEWDGIENEINPLHMPITRLANTAVDGVAQEMQAVLEDITRYAGSDLLCYRADSPEGLVEKQREHWDPVLDWVENRLGKPFTLVEGIMHSPQSKETIAAFSSALKDHVDPFKLTAMHTITSISGSAILALALAEAGISSDDTWLAAHVDEDWNIGLWGEDYEAKERREQRKRDFDAACALFDAVNI